MPKSPARRGANPVSPEVIDLLSSDDDDKIGICKTSCKPGSTSTFDDDSDDDTDDDADDDDVGTKLAANPSSFDNDSEDDDDDVNAKPAAKISISSSKALQPMRTFNKIGKLGDSIGEEDDDVAKPTAKSNVSSFTVSQSTTSKRGDKWAVMYALSKKEADDNGFSKLKAGTPVYGWMKRQENQIDEYKRSPDQFMMTSRALTPERIVLVEPLIEMFTEQFSNRRSGGRSTSASARSSNDLGRSRSRSRSRSKSRVKHFCGFSMVDGQVDFDSANLCMIGVDSSAKCRNAANQHLFGELATLAFRRLHVLGHAQRNTGHFMTGVKWYAIAKQLMKTPVHIKSTKEAKVFLEGVKESGTLVDALDHYFETGDLYKYR